MSFDSRKSIASPIKFALLAAAFAWGSVMAADSDGDIDLTGAVTSLPPSVTLSTAALPTYASYSVTLTHYPNAETLNPVTFRATATVLDASNNPVTGQIATFQGSSLPSSCSATAPTSVLCTFTNFPSAANSTLTFSVTFNAPSAGNHIHLTAQASYVEDDSPGPYSFDITPVDTALTLPNPLAVNSFVPPAGATVFTGTNNGFPAPAPSSTWAALATVPPNTGGTTASIVNAIPDNTGCPRSATLLDCSSSTITIPGTFNGLAFILRRDASTITKKADISSAIVYYDSPATGFGDPRITYTGYAFHVPACTDTTYGRLPQIGIPCIYSRAAVYSDKPGNDTNPNGKDDTQFKRLLYWEFVIHAVDNGRFTN